MLRMLFSVHLRVDKFLDISASKTFYLIFMLHHRLYLNHIRFSSFTTSVYANTRVQPYLLPQYQNRVIMLPSRKEMVALHNKSLLLLLRLCLRQTAFWWNQPVGSKVPSAKQASYCLSVFQVAREKVDLKYLKQTMVRRG